VVTVAPAAGTAVVGVPHEGTPPPVGDAEVAAGGEEAPLVDPPVHGWVTGGIVGIGATGADAGGGFVVVVVPAGGKAPVGGLVLAGVGDGVAAGVVATVGGAVVVGVVDDVVVAGD
jgi:hypothetical protein